MHFVIITDHIVIIPDHIGIITDHIGIIQNLFNKSSRAPFGTKSGLDLLFSWERMKN